MRTVLAKITNATFGFGGYDGAEIGLSFTFMGDGTGCGDFIGTWASPPSERARWTVEDQRGHWADAVEKLRDTLTAAKRKDVAGLVGIPVELTFDGNTLASWRVLTEVL